LPTDTLAAGKGGAEGEDPHTISQPTKLGPSRHLREGLGGNGTVKCHSGDAVNNKKIAGSDLDSHEYTEASPGVVDMDTKKGMAESVKPSRPPAWGPEINGSELGGGCINAGPNMHGTTEPQLGEPMLSTKHSELQSLKRECNLYAGVGVLDQNKFERQRKTGVTGTGYTPWEAPGRSRRSGGTLPEVCRHHR
jgi:hypothetical protein